MKIAILGGKFDPIHRGHLQIAHHALNGFSVNEVLFIPCAISPHKSDSALLSADHRLAMLRSAVADEPRFQVLDLEIKRGGTSYTIDTLHQLQKERAGAQFFFLLGSDNVQAIGSWRKFQELTQLCDFLVIERPGHPLLLPPLSVRPNDIPSARFHVLKGAAPEVASSEIRRLLREGKKVSHLLPTTVHKYIQTHQLYLG